MVDVLVSSRSITPRAPRRILLLHAGDINWSGMTAFLDESAAQQIIEDFKRQGVQLPVDYHHQTTKAEDGLDIKAEAAGWITDLVYVAGKGLYGFVEWTDEARELIESKKFKYISPVVYFEKATGKLSGLHSVALTNRPRTRELPELLAQAAHRKDAKTMAGDIKADAKEKQAAVMDEMPAVDPVSSALKEIISVLGLSPEASMTEVLQAVIAKIGKGNPEEEEEDEEKESQEETAHMAELKIKAESYDAMAGRIAALEKAAADNQEKEKQRTAAELVEEQIEAGRLLPDAKDAVAAAKDLANKDPEGFKKIFAAMPVVAPPGRVMTEGTFGASGRPSDRTSLIAAELRGYDSETHVLKTTKAGWVNAGLMAAGLPRLTRDEVKALDTNSKAKEN